MNSHCRPCPLVVLCLPLALAYCQEVPTSPGVAHSSPVASRGAAAGAERTAFTGAVTGCVEIDPGETWTSGTAVHTRAIGRECVAVSTDDRIAGTLEAIVDQLVIPETGMGQERLVMVLHPEALGGGGAWEISTVVTWNSKQFRHGRGTGSGTGVLAGQRLTWEWEEGGGIDDPPGTTTYVVQGMITALTEG